MDIEMRTRELIEEIENLPNGIGIFSFHSEDVPQKEAMAEVISMKVQLLVFAENGARVVLVHEGMYLVKDGLDSWVFDLRTSCLYNPVVGKEAEKVT